MFGRSKLATKRGASVSESRSAISLRVNSSAVAVSAIRGTSGNRSGDHREADIFRAKVVAPLRDAMRLVDRKQRDVGLAEQARGSAASSSRSGAT